MLNQELSEIFAHMAEMLEFLGGDAINRFRIRAYQNASLAIRDVPESLEKMAKEKRLKEIPGVGEGMKFKIEEYISTGKIKEYEMMKKQIPKGIFELMEIPSLGPKKVHILASRLKIFDMNSLKKAIEKGTLQKLPGFGKRSAEKILEGIEIKKSKQGRMMLGEVYLLVQTLISNLKKMKEVKEAVPAGSFRRAEETVGDIDILVTTKKESGIEKEAEKIMNYFVKLPDVKTILAKGPTKVSILTHESFQVDVRVVKPSQFGSALQYFTGSKNHNVHLRTYAKAHGFKLSEYGFFKNGKLVARKTEEECYKAIGMQFIPPELRNDTGEIEAALKGKIPKDLIRFEDLRGDLHAHSTYSDGGNSIEEMALSAHKRGYEYIAITDHSPSLPIAHGLKLPELKKKKKEIERLNEKLPIKILYGTEVDIKADGSIDYPDEILKEFDVVVASIHSRFNQDNTERLLKAMQNPYVNIIGHPSGRMIGHRNPYPLNYEKLFRQARDTGTAIEINSHYERLDLQDEYMREAHKFGVKFSIDSDAHSTSGLWMVELGCAWARRGWVTKKEVINTMTLKELQNFLKK